jgi:hypothetical protein
MGDCLFKGNNTRRDMNGEQRKKGSADRMWARDNLPDVVDKERRKEKNEGA